MHVLAVDLVGALDKVSHLGVLYKAERGMGSRDLILPDSESEATSPTASSRLQ